MTNTTGTITAPAKGIDSISHEVRFGTVTVYVAVEGNTNARTAENVARGYLRKQWGPDANVIYIGRYGTIQGGKHGYRFDGIYMQNSLNVPPLNGIKVY